MPLPHALMMLIPEAWADNPLMDPDRRAFYEYHAALMEPWDGPAAIAFTDGRQIGATLDRNGLRPARFFVTDDDHVVMASEAGVLDVPEERIVRKWRLEPGKMLLVDLERGRIIDDDELKAEIATAKPYQRWLDETQIKLETLPDKVSPMAPPRGALLDRQQAFGYTQEDIVHFLKPIALSGEDTVGAMGRDTPARRPVEPAEAALRLFPAALRPGHQPADRFDPRGAGDVARLAGRTAAESSRPRHRRQAHPARIAQADPHQRGSREDPAVSRTIPAAPSAPRRSRCAIPRAKAPRAWRARSKLSAAAPSSAVRGGYNIVVLSDRQLAAEQIAVPSLLAVASVHHHLIRGGLRTEVGLVVETGEARLLHDFCLLAGYGAEAINPYLAFDTLSALHRDFDQELTEQEAHEAYIKAIAKGLLKVMSKMGICTFQSYCGAQIFDAIGLNAAFLDQYFTGTVSAIGGAGLDEIAEETVRRHRLAFGDAPNYRDALDIGGELAFRVSGETHVWTADTVALLQHAVRGNNYRKFKEFTRLVGEQEQGLVSLRGLLDFDFAADPIPLSEVEPAASIVKRFSTGAMSFGSISWEAHTTLAIAMNRLAGRSNTGEGGEDPQRYKPLPNGDSMRSAIHQVASGRFGVNIEYLVNATDLQIKMAQGAKPGEGGQLPGHKVDDWIARTRYSVPGVGLISPPPHHDIYSIEDLAQLIHDLKNANRDARISVKLVAELGVGTIAAGVCKAYADHVTISGHDGGTGASPLTSIYHAGEPWEVGIAETHQTLVLNGLRGRIAVQVDGGIRSGARRRHRRDARRRRIRGRHRGARRRGLRDDAQMPSQHLPGGRSDAGPRAAAALRRQARGRRHLLHVLGRGSARADGEARLPQLQRDDRPHRQARAANRHQPSEGAARSTCRACCIGRTCRPEPRPISARSRTTGSARRSIIGSSPSASRRSCAARRSRSICRSATSTARSGAMLSGEVARRYGDRGLPDGTIRVRFAGTAGQSFGAFLARGIAFELEGAANDYVGKGLSGGRLVVYPPKRSKIERDKAIIVGNTVLYGAISGECYFSGVAGERFAVRNSGAVAVVEGAGSHCCEYMTGGIVVVLGETGNNFAAGMSGGVAFVFDESGMFQRRCNLAMVDLEPMAVEDEHLEALEHRGGDLEAHGLVDVVRGLTQSDARLLHNLVARHAHLTESPKAKAILAAWPRHLAQFVKVMPIEYRRALQKMQIRSRAGERSDATVAVGAAE